MSDDVRDPSLPPPLPAVGGAPDTRPAAAPEEAPVPEESEVDTGSIPVISAPPPLTDQPRAESLSDLPEAPVSFPFTPGLGLRPGMFTPPDQTPPPTGPIAIPGPGAPAAPLSSSVLPGYPQPTYRPQPLPGNFPQQVQFNPAGQFAPPSNPYAQQPTPGAYLESHYSSLPAVPVKPAALTRTTTALAALAATLFVLVAATGVWWSQGHLSRRGEIASLQDEHQAHVQQVQTAQTQIETKYAAAALPAKWQAVTAANARYTLTQNAFRAKYPTTQRTIPLAAGFKLVGAVRECLGPVVEYNRTAGQFPATLRKDLPAEVDMGSAGSNCDVIGWIG